nr:MAG TPA: LysM [Caudoviricetes sp.]
MKLKNAISKFAGKALSCVSTHLAAVLLLTVVILSAVFLLAGKQAEDGSITLDGSKAKIDKATEEFIKDAKIAMAQQAKKALITVDGKEEQVDLPTIDNIDSSKSTKDEKSETGGRGWWVDTSSPLAFRNATIGKCIDTDGAYGSQCWDLGNLFWQNYAGRSFNTCGTGAAKGTIQNGCWQRNAGNEFDMIWDKNQIKAGDWVIFGGGQWGHVGMALGGNNGGYVALLGTNQGGGWCAGGGSSTNQINMSLGSFIGAFRPKKYDSAASKPAAPATHKAVDETVISAVIGGQYGSGSERVARLQSAGYNPAEVQAAVNARIAARAPRVSAPASTGYVQRSTSSYVVRRGDTLGHIALRNGWHNGTGGLFGNSGYTQRLAERNGIANRGLIYPGQRINP